MDRSLLYSQGPNLFDLYIKYIKVIYLWLDTIDLDPTNFRQMCSAIQIGQRGANSANYSRTDVGENS